MTISTTAVIIYTAIGLAIGLLGYFWPEEK
jgi:hypothetical protein